MGRSSSNAWLSKRSSSNGIVAARVERVAAGESAEGQPAALQDTVPVDGLVGVAGAGGPEAAGWRQEPGEGALVDGNEAKCEDTHQAATPRPARRSADRRRGAVHPGLPRPEASCQFRDLSKRRGDLSRASRPLAMLRSLWRGRRGRRRRDGWRHG